ncbi:hypothetical protein [Pseudomonas sp. Pseu.R1]|uniref:hypothetical protein n=1 Tax=Pseudomonas sp. Pseu.R1 TaxID=3379818 RepID=UPI003B93B9A0
MMRHDDKKAPATGSAMAKAIGPNEETLSATEIVERYRALYGHALHPTNAGNAARALGLDYIEVPNDEMAQYGKMQKRYAAEDLDLIFKRLDVLVASRSKYQ